MRLPSADHRPWGVPRSPWVMAMRWERLLFAHWPVDAAALAAVLPGELEVEEFDGTAWLGVVPFEMRGVRLRGLPPAPGLSRFPELNVRTYVTVGGKPGVYFFSLDAAHRLAVRTARRWFGLPYHYAEMSCRRDGQGFTHYLSRRADERGPRATFAGKYRPVAAVKPAQPGSLDAFLTERYCFYTVDGAGVIRRSEVHHAPWPLQQAEAELQVCDMTAMLGLDLPPTPAVLHYADRLVVAAWLPRPVSDGPG